MNTKPPGIARGPALELLAAAVSRIASIAVFINSCLLMPSWIGRPALPVLDGQRIRDALMLRISPRPHRDTLFMGGSPGATFPQFLEDFLLAIESLTERPQPSLRENPISINFRRIHSAPGSR
ncbi:MULTISPECIES: hypothetical protein [unclassified Variovorax]|uniref:hypothetical protein n=1 Tax=unclassified Variovorax TaxID=663243 RepID=UPI0034E884B3